MAHAVSPTPVSVAPAPERDALERRARRLAWAGNAWHVVEFGVAVAAGVAAGSIALVAFGVDSLIELVAGLVVVWRFSGARAASPAAERWAQRLVAASFALLAAYIVAESARTLVGSSHPETSWPGIGLALVTAAAMPMLARAKRRVAFRLGSAAAVSEAGQNMLCAYLSLALLAGLGANAAVGWWWADPLAALAIAAIAAHEGVAVWRAGPGADHCC